jgi:uncharacterized membrane protein YfcA
VTLVAGLLSALVACALLLVSRWWIRATSPTGALSEAVTGRTAPPLPSLEERAKRLHPRTSIVHIAVGFVTNFFDTLGIGSFAPTTAAFRLLRLVPDELIPGTMIVGHALPVVTQALFFITAVRVDPLQMTMLIGVCVAGGWLGAGIVASLTRSTVQIGMGCALIAASVFMLLGMFGWFPAGGTALALPSVAFVFAVVINFVLGALLTLGIGNYAPSLVVFSLLGMDPRAAFPIMMGSGAFVATIAGVRFINTGRFHHHAALGLAAGGIPGVIVAAWLIQSLPLATLRWLVLVVVSYVAISLLRAGVRDTLAKTSPVAPGADLSSFTPQAESASEAMGTKKGPAPFR